MRGTLRESESRRVALTYGGRALAVLFSVLLWESPPNGAGRTGDHLWSDRPYLRLFCGEAARGET